MNVLLLLGISAVLIIYSTPIDAKGRRSRHESCKRLQYKCIQRKLYRFDKRHRPSMVCLKHEPLVQSNSTDSYQGYYTLAKRKSCDGEGDTGVVQLLEVPRKCIQEKPREGLQHILLNQTCTKSTFRSYYEKRQELYISAIKLCSSKVRIRHKKCGKFRNLDIKRSTIKDEETSVLVTTTTPEYTPPSLESPEPNSTVFNDTLVELNGKNVTKGYVDLDQESGYGVARPILITSILLSLLLIMIILIVVYGCARKYKLVLICKKDEHFSDSVENTSSETPFLCKFGKDCGEHNINETKSRSGLTQELYDLFPLSNTTTCTCYEVDGQYTSINTTVPVLYIPSITKPVCERRQVNFIKEDYIEEEIPLLTRIRLYDIDLESLGAADFSKRINEYSSDTKSSGLFSLKCNCTSNALKWMLDTHKSDQYKYDWDEISKSSGYASQMNDETLSEEPKEVGGSEEEDIIPVERISTDRIGNLMFWDQYGRLYVDSIASVPSWEFSTLEYDFSITSLAQIDRTYNHYRFENSLPSREPKPKRSSLCLNLLCPKPVLLYSASKANSVFGVLCTSFTDQRQLRRSTGFSAEEEFHLNSNFDEFDSLSWHSSDDDMKTIPILQRIDPDTRACPEKISLLSEFYSSSFSSFSSTHIRLGDTSHCAGEGSETDQQEERDEAQENNGKNVRHVGDDEDDGYGEDDEERDEEDDGDIIMGRRNNGLDDTHASDEYMHRESSETGYAPQTNEQDDDDEMVANVRVERKDHDIEKDEHEGGIRSNNEYKTPKGKQKNNFTTIRNDLKESVKPGTIMAISLDKESNQSDQNNLRSYYKDGGTQTKSQNLPRTILNTDWAAEASFGGLGGELQTENSSVRLIVTPDTVKESESVTIHARVHVDLKRLTRVLKIPTDEFIVSPAPEYHLNADWRKVITKPMIIQLPVNILAMCNTENLCVYGFQSTEGQVVKYPIGEKSKENHNVYDPYFEICEDRKNILIYTYHFSGVVACLKCAKDVQIPGYLNARIKGYNIPKSTGREVKIRYEFFIENNNDIKDFHEQNQSEKEHNRLVLLEKQVRINLPVNVDNDTKMIIKLDVTGDECDLWECRKLRSGQEMFPLEREVSIRQLVTCNTHIDPFYIDFVLLGKPDTPDTPLQPFECLIFVFEKDVDGTEGAAGMLAENRSYINIDGLYDGFEAATLGDKEEVFKDEQRCGAPLRRSVQEEQAYFWAQPNPQSAGTNLPPPTSKILVNNYSMAELLGRDKSSHRRGEVLFGGRDAGEDTNGPQAMAELYQNDRPTPCENSDSTDYNYYHDTDQTVPKDPMT